MKTILAAGMMTLIASSAFASSHREAPIVASVKSPKKVVKPGIDKKKVEVLRPGREMK